MMKEAKASNLRGEKTEKRVQEYNRVFNTESDEFTNKTMLTI